MNSMGHVCQSGSAEELVRTVVGEGVIGIADDCSIGPLRDVDSASPDARVAFWTALFALDEKMSSMAWRTEFCAVNEALAALGRETIEVVIWTGSSPGEQAMRRRVHWWLKDAPVSITEVLVGTEDVVDPDRCIHHPIAIVSIERLRARFEGRSPATIEDRRRLAAEWEVLREKGHGVRMWEGGCLFERGIDHYDAYLLSLVGSEPVRFVDVLGQAMAETGRSDAFCKWRFATLVQTGRVSLPQGELRDCWHARVCRTYD